MLKGQFNTILELWSYNLQKAMRFFQQENNAKAILSTLTVESINRDAYTIVELVDQAYVQTCKRAYAIVATEKPSNR